MYIGIEVQPSVRTALTVRKNNTLWAAIMRAVRTPSRLDVDLFSPVAPQPPSIASIAGGPTFRSEKALCVRVGLSHTTQYKIILFNYRLLQSI